MRVYVRLFQNPPGDSHVGSVVVPSNGVTIWAGRHEFRCTPQTRSLLHRLRPGDWVEAGVEFSTSGHSYPAIVEAIPCGMPGTITFMLNGIPLLCELLEGKINYLEDPHIRAGFPTRACSLEFVGLKLKDGWIRIGGQRLSWFLRGLWYCIAPPEELRWVGFDAPRTEFPYCQIGRPVQVGPLEIHCKWTTVLIRAPKNPVLLTMKETRRTIEVCNTLKSWRFWYAT